MLFTQNHSHLFLFELILNVRLHLTAVFQENLWEFRVTKTHTACTVEIHIAVYFLK